MATENVAILRKVSASDQAEMLTRVVLCEDLKTFHDKVQNGVLWLLADLITEARGA